MKCGWFDEVNQQQFAKNVCAPESDRAVLLVNGVAAEHCAAKKRALQCRSVLLPSSGMITSDELKRIRKEAWYHG